MNYIIKMAYANTVLFYGWYGIEALSVLKHLIGEHIEIELKRCDANTELYCKNVNKKLEKHKLTFAMFEGGCGSSEFCIKSYLHFGSGILLQSNDENDIKADEYASDELELVIAEGLVFSRVKNNRKLPKPSLKCLVVSDPK